VVEVPGRQEQGDSEGEYEAVEQDHSGDADADTKSGEEECSVIRDHDAVTSEAESWPRRSGRSL
jgi:hypothetical protein